MSANWEKDKMVKLLGGRGASAVLGFFMLALGSSVVSARDLTSYPRDPLSVSDAVKALDVTPGTKMIGQAVTVATQAATTAAVAVQQPVATTPSALGAPVAQEAAWLHRNGWPLQALVDRYGASAEQLDEQANCIAVAVYHEARGETLEGQLAVARVIMNRAASGKYPSSWCGTVKQPWQFSFVNPRDGRMPGVDRASTSWHRALGITRLAINNAVPTISNDVLWYHADYVAPSWGRRLSKVSKIGAHIFYRS